MIKDIQNLQNDMKKTYQMPKLDYIRQGSRTVSRTYRTNTASS